MYRDNDEQRICTITKGEVDGLVAGKIGSLEIEARSFEEALATEESGDGKAYLAHRMRYTREQAQGYAFIRDHLDGGPYHLTPNELLALRERLLPAPTNVEQEIKYRPWAQQNKLGQEMPMAAAGRLW